MKNLSFLTVILLLFALSSCNKDSFDKQATDTNVGHTGFDFSENSQSGTSDGEVVGWYPGGGSNPDYPSGLFWRNDGSGNKQAHLGTIDPDDVTTIPDKWDDPLVPMLVDHVYIYKCEDGYVLLKVTSLPNQSSNPGDWTVGVQYVFSATGEF